MIPQSPLAINRLRPIVFPRFSVAEELKRARIILASCSVRTLTNVVIGRLASNNITLHEALGSIHLSTLHESARLSRSAAGSLLSCVKKVTDSPNQRCSEEEKKIILTVLVNIISQLRPSILPRVERLLKTTREDIPTIERGIHEFIQSSIGQKNTEMMLLGMFFPGIASSCAHVLNAHHGNVQTVADNSSLSLQIASAIAVIDEVGSAQHKTAVDVLRDLKDHKS